ncbi:MAG: NAD(P)/FAD-dependent oxidoreductase [Chitinophagaceae bacterium]|nr:MAG: NAD(P)/FAD-dependent oxidoreductase [Chitinophagaceae bacterium]
MQTDYDIAIVGGGLAGLAASIQLKRLGYSVILFEKDSFPHHKVCGEYVSLESKDFLMALGLPVNELHLPIIDTLLLTAPNGKVLTTKLPLGGMGISRYLLDSSLASIAQQAGVVVSEKTKIDDVKSIDNYFSIVVSNKQITAKICCGAFGKRSNLDIKWNRDFVHRQNNRLNNYVGVKYHVRTNWKENVIGLHNFKNGYCGISKIEDDKYCLCYMTRAENLKASGNSITQMEEKVLYQNPHLKTIFQQSEILQHFPVTISQISFSQKEKVERNMLMLGDAAGMITPLCGNGMSIALHTSKIAAELIHLFMQGKLSTDDLLKHYQQHWQQNFASRLKTGRILQSFFGSNSLSNLLVSMFVIFPSLAKPLIRLTHGKPF